MAAGVDHTFLSAALWKQVNLTAFCGSILLTTIVDKPLWSVVTVRFRFHRSVAVFVIISPQIVVVVTFKLALRPC